MPPAETSTSLKKEVFSKQEIEHIVLETLEKNPQIILSALKQAVLFEENEKFNAQQKLVQKHSGKLFQDPYQPSLGNPKGRLQIVSFFDYRCDFCKKSDALLSNLLKTNSDVYIVYRELPILGALSLYLSKIALAASLQGKYALIHEAFMSSSKPLAKNEALQIARKVGLNMSKLEKDMESQIVTNILNENYKLAQTLQIEAAPFFIIGEKIVPGLLSKETLEAILLEKKKS